MDENDSILPSELLGLKEKINNELKRRNRYGSMTGYTDDIWQFSSKPHTGMEIDMDILKKIYDPVLQISDFQIDNSLSKTGEDISSIKDVDRFIKKISKEPYSGDSSCRGDCTGLCSHSCSAECTGCTGQCTNSCQGCTNTCGSSCSGCSGCSTGCLSGCNGCTGCSSCSSGSMSSS